MIRRQTSEAEKEKRRFTSRRRAANRQSVVTPLGLFRSITAAGMKHGMEAAEVVVCVYDATPGWYFVPHQTPETHRAARVVAAAGQA